jgi:hypothetical protein
VRIFCETAKMEGREYASKEEQAATFKSLRSRVGNQTCFDCNTRQPSWASVTFGVFVCYDCSGQHRRLGTHITFIRSCDMDKWTTEQLRVMTVGGNENARQFFRDKGWEDMTAKVRHHFAATYFCTLLHSAVRGRMLDGKAARVTCVHTSFYRGATAVA